MFALIYPSVGLREISIRTLYNPLQILGNPPNLDSSESPKVVLESRAVILNIFTKLPFLTFFQSFISIITLNEIDQNVYISSQYWENGFNEIFALKLSKKSKHLLKKTLAEKDSRSRKKSGISFLKLEF